MDVDHDGQDATSDDWTISRARGSLDMLVWHVVGMMLEPQEGQRSMSFGVYHALTGLTSHLRGLTS